MEKEDKLRRPQVSWDIYKGMKHTKIFAHLWDSMDFLVHKVKKMTIKKNI